MDRLLRARVQLSEAETLGLTVDDLVAAASDTPAVTPSVPTVSEYLAWIIPTFTKGRLRTYRSYWRLAEAHFGDRPLNTITVDDCEAVVIEAARRAQRQRPGTDARSPKENCVAALRALFKRAKRARLILENPAEEVDKPRRLPNRRRSLTDDELAEAIEAVRTTSRDLDLDLLIVRFHLESGARQEGALHLVVDDLDKRRSTVWLREKFGKEREQPVSPSLTAALTAHARRRGATKGTDAVFRTARSRPTSRRHYDTLFKHVQAALPWTVRTPVTAHVLRHTAPAAIERIAGEAVAEAFLGHQPTSVTGTYTKGRLGEVAAAVVALTGEPHPLAETKGRSHHAA
jgi:site-specific recombinase XerD